MARTNELELQVPARLPAMMYMKVKWVKIPRVQRKNHAIFAATKEKAPSRWGIRSAAYLNEKALKKILGKIAVKFLVKILEMIIFDA